MTINPNLSPSTVASFGDEWQRFDQHDMALGLPNDIFAYDFSNFP